MKLLQDYLLSNFDINPNTSATIIISLLVFFMGIAFQRLIALYIGYNRRSKVRQIFFIALKNIIDQLIDQSEGYLKSSKSFSFEKEFNFTIIRASLFSASSLQSLGYEKTYEALFTGVENFFSCNQRVRLKAFNKVWQTVKAVEFWHDHSFSDINRFNDRYNSLNERRGNALEEHRKLVENILIPLQGKLLPEIEGKYLQKVDDIHFEWQKIPDRTRPDITHRQLVLKLRILNRKNSSIPLANKMNANLLEASILYMDQSSLLKAKRDQFHAFYRSFRYYSRICKVSGKILE